MASNKNAISPSREEDYSEWYQQVIKAADLAEHSPIRGCMVIKPWGYGIWENIQKILDRKLKKTGHQNAYFPLFIPLSYFEKEAKHIEGFAKECAIVTHSKLKKESNGKLVPTGELEEPLIVRPTSEMIIGEMFSKWVQSYRDLPILLNQWANIVRWEMRTRMFLRTTEFLWQEGHTVHATKEEAEEEVKKMLDVYADFCHNYLAMPVIKGEKTESETFPGADNTYCIEAMMQDKKALQGGTSHFLGQNFSKSCNITFRDKNEETQYAWMSSWGVTTRLIGGIIMTHSDDDGLVLPPKIAASQVVIIPVIHNEKTKEMVLDYCEKLQVELQCLLYDNEPIRIELDKRDIRGGEKKWSWIKKGIPVRIEIGPRDIENDSLCINRRDLPHNETKKVSRLSIADEILKMLDDMQNNLYKKAKDFQKMNTHRIDSKDEFYKFFTPKNKDKPEIHGGFAKSHWCTDPKCEEKIKDDLNVTIRCIPLLESEEKGKCILCNKDSKKRVIFAKSY